MLNENPVNEAKKIFDKTGIKVLAAFDGMSIDINIKNPAKSNIISLKDQNSRRFQLENENTFQSMLSSKNNEFKDNVPYLDKKGNVNTFTKDFSNGK
jgi:hypothetical protein